MADSETKARRKLEEAEKKTRGGGGFLGKIFGGGGADEAADLFIQHDTEHSISSEEEYGFDDTPPTSSDVLIECDMCRRDFTDIIAFETHYQAAHSYQCVACSKMFISEKALNIHSDEKHCPFYQMRLEKDPNGYHFKCYHDLCEQGFTTEQERDSHCLKKHNIVSVEVIVERRKLAKRLHDLERSLNRVTVSSKRNRAVPRVVRFGEQERGFEGVAKLRCPMSKISEH